MREIKFRAWSETRREMREVSIVSFGPPITAYSHDNWMAMGDNLVLTQFTGLRDKDGKEIYEGDIVSRADGNEPKGAHIVMFAFGGFHLSPDGIAIPHLLFPADEELRYGGDIPAFEIIGNVYEHREILNDLWNSPVE